MRSIPAISTRFAVRRRGSPFTGAGIVLAKEAADQLSGIRMVVIEVLVFLIALVLAWFSTNTIRESIGESPFLFLRLLTISPDPIPFSFIDIVGLVAPVIAIALGFDAVNAEFNQRTLSRILAQPIYRDALLLGKFLARLLALTIALVSLWLLVLGVGFLRLGLPPSFEELVRMVGFLVATIAYGGVWLAVAFLFSVFWSVVIRPLVATMIAGPAEDIFGPNLAYVQTSQVLDRISPNTLYAEIALALLQPSTRTLGPVFFSQLRGALIGAPLRAGQSFILVWPQITGLIAGIIVIFAAGYIVFQRQEIRA